MEETLEKEDSTSKMIENIIEEKFRKQRQIMDLDIVDEENLLDLIREIKGESVPDPKETGSN